MPLWAQIVVTCVTISIVLGFIASRFEDAEERAVVAGVHRRKSR